MNQLNKLFENFQLNKIIKLPNRIIMAPMTRNMANNDLSPTLSMVDYYSKRADAGLIVTEGTIISPEGRGYSNTPGIYTKKYIDGWKRVTQAVHERQGKIFLQIWHVGRVSHPVFLNGALPVSASDTSMIGKIPRSEGLYYGKARALSIPEIQETIRAYAKASANAVAAGFDGIEIHGANGYLIDQFLHYQTNQREDKYGIHPENLARFALEIVDACIAEIGPGRLGLRLSPGAYLNEIVGDSRDAAVFKYLLKQLNKMNIAYVHTGNFDNTRIFQELDNKTMSEFIRTYYDGNLIASGGYTVQQACQSIMENKFDLIALGRPFIANPDLIERIKNSLTLKSYDPTMLKTLV